jgi:glycosyltransferase involved in cell wall biosynthesis
MERKKLIRITTIPISLKILLKGQLKYMNRFYNVQAVCSDGNDFEEMIKELDVPCTKINMTRQITLLKDLIALTKLIILFRKERPQIVHTHTPKAGTLGMLAAWICHVPVRMHTVAGLPLLEVSGLRRVLLDFVEKITYACASSVYPNSYGLKDIIIQNNYCTLSKVKVIGNGSSNGIDTNFFSKAAVDYKSEKELKKVYKISQSNFVFIFIGRLVTDKGINELVKAFDSVFKKYPNAKLILVGNRESDLDPLKEETELILQSHPAIIQTGHQSDVRTFLSITDVLIFPSYREGFPNVVMQAGAMSLPSIVTNINGCNEIIQENVNGILIPPKNTLAIENAMIELMKNNEMRERFAQNARPLVIERYEQQKVWHLLKEEYNKQLRKVNIF